MYEKVFGLFHFTLFSFAANAATKTWIGTPSSPWNVAGNWSPSGVPEAADDVIISLTTTIAIDISPISINSLTITNNSTVLFDCNATRNITLNSISAGTPGLLIDGGSTLTIDGSNVGTNNSTLFVSGGAGVIGTINGTLVFSSSGGSRGAGASIHLDTNTGVSNYGIVTVNNGGTIKIQADAGNTATSLTPVPNMIMKNGSTYQSSRNGGSFPVGTWETTSLAKATSVGANGPSFNGTIYGNLEWNCPVQTAVTFFSSDVSFNNVNFITTNNTAFRIRTGASAGIYTMTVNGNLDISNTSILELTSSTVVSPNGGKLHLLGNLNNSGTILTTGIAGTVNDFELDGSVNQNITNTGSLSGARLSFIINNPAGATLLTPVTLPYKLTLTSGKIKTTSTNILSMSDNAPIPTGGSSTSFVEGPMKKGGHDDTFTFPIGIGSIYAPATYFSFGLIASDTIRAEYVRGNPQTTYGTSYDPTNIPFHIDHISFVEHWKVQKTTPGTVSHNLTVYFTEYSFCKIFNSTFVTSYHPGSSIWQSCGINTLSTAQTGTSGPYVFGYISTIGQNIDDSIFTLGTNDPFASNPLPITLITFDASKLSNTKSSINWELAACCSAAAKFEIQKVDANKAFVTIGAIGGSETNKLYHYIDNGLKNGINYYRLKMIDADGKITYSRTVAVMNGVNGLLLTSLIPTVVTNQSTLTVASSDQQKLDIVIVDMQGRVVLKRNYTIAAGNTNIGLQLNGLMAGVYQLTGISAEGKTNTIRFIKQ